MSEIALDIQQLSKTYDSGTQALDHISFQVKQGDFFGLLGPNGAGKSTTIGIISSLVKKDSGVVSIFGHDLWREPELSKRLIGIVPQEFNFNIFDRVIDIIVNQGGYFGISRGEAVKRADQILDMLQMSDKRHTPALNLSGGYKRRLLIARSLINSPKLLILDEPTAGADVELRRLLWSILEQLNADGMTIILTTHYLEEAERLCRNIAIIDHGKIVEMTSKAMLLNQLKSETVMLDIDPMSTVPEIPPFSIKQVDDSLLEVLLTQNQALGSLIGQLQAGGVSVRRVRSESTRLEKLFLELTGTQSL